MICRPIIAVALAVVLSGMGTAAQEGPTARIVKPRAEQPAATLPAQSAGSQTTAVWNGFEFSVNPKDGAVCYVVERHETFSGATLTMVCFVAALEGWQAIEGVVVPADGQYKGALLGDAFVPGIAEKVN